MLIISSVILLIQNSVEHSFIIDFCLEVNILNPIGLIYFFIISNLAFKIGSLSKFKNSDPNVIYSKSSIFLVPKPPIIMDSLSIIS